MNLLSTQVRQDQGDVSTDTEAHASGQSAADVVSEVTKILLPAVPPVFSSSIPGRVTPLSVNGGLSIGSLRSA